MPFHIVKHLPSRNWTLSGIEAWFPAELIQCRHHKPQKRRKQKTRGDREPIPRLASPWFPGPEQWNGSRKNTYLLKGEALVTEKKHASRVLPGIKSSGGWDLRLHYAMLLLVGMIRSK